MNLKYYLRGLGIGILVTALIMNIAAGRKETLTNEEIKERAKALGMVEEGTLLEDAQAALNTLGNSGTSSNEESEDAQNLTGDGALEETPKQQGSETSEQSENETPEGTPEQSESEAPEGTSEQSESEAPEGTPGQSEAQQPEEEREPEDTQESEVIVETEGVWPPDETGEDGENITVQVTRGESSYTVCKRLEEVGIISSASEFDTFLCQNGYDKKIRAGTFEIPRNASPEQIARILSGT